MSHTVLPQSESFVGSCSAKRVDLGGLLHCSDLTNLEGEIEIILPVLLPSLAMRLQLSCSYPVHHPPLVCPDANSSKAPLHCLCKEGHVHPPVGQGAGGEGWSVALAGKECTSSIHIQMEKREAILYPLCTSPL